MKDRAETMRYVGQTSDKYDVVPSEIIAESGTNTVRLW